MQSKIIKECTYTSNIGNIIYEFNIRILEQDEGYVVIYSCNGTRLHAYEHGVDCEERAKEDFNTIRDSIMDTIHCLTGKQPI